MIRLRITKDHKQYKTGETIYATPNEAHALIDSGYAKLTKDMTSKDYPQKTPRKKKWQN